MAKLLKRKPIMGPTHEIKDIKVNGIPIEEVDPFGIEPDCLFFSDLHLHDRQEFRRVDPDTGLNVRLTEGLWILEQILTLIRKHDIRFVFHLGDIFELKDKVPNHVLKEFRNRLEEIKREAIVTSLLGNHDYNIPNYTTLDLFDGGDKFLLVTEPQDLWAGYFIPYQRKWEDFKEMWAEAHKAKPKLICMHQEIAGSEYESGKKAAGIFDLHTDPKILYLSGHMHKPQRIHGIQYLGSPYPTKFDTYKGDYFVWLYNSKTQALKRLRLDYSKFISLDWNKIYKKEEMKKLVSGNYVKVVGEVRREDIDKESKESFKREAEGFGAKAVIFNVKIKSSSSQSKIEKDLVGDDISIINQFAKDNLKESGLEERRLIETGVRAYENA